MILYTISALAVNRVMSFIERKTRVPGFVAKSLTLLLEDVRGLWHEVRSVPLTLPGE